MVLLFLHLPPKKRFHGTGVYAIYYTGKNELYTSVPERNRIEFSLPIYVGKAVPRGWRQARAITQADKKTYELNGRLREHARSIEQGRNLLADDFYCRFMILEDAASSLIGTVEAALIRFYLPLWNTKIDGFGNHDPDKGRYNQAKSDWDILHPGRPWADKCLGDSPESNIIEDKLIEYTTRQNKK